MAARRARATIVEDGFDLASTLVIFRTPPWLRKVRADDDRFSSPLLIPHTLRCAAIADDLNHFRSVVLSSWLRTAVELCSGRDAKVLSPRRVFRTSDIEQMRMAS